MILRDLSIAMQAFASAENELSILAGSAYDSAYALAPQSSSYRARIRRSKVMRKVRPKMITSEAFEAFAGLHGVAVCGSLLRRSPPRTESDIYVEDGISIIDQSPSSLTLPTRRLPTSMARDRTPHMDAHFRGCHTQPSRDARVGRK